MKNICKYISEIISDIQPFDEIERSHQGDALRWIESGVEIFRIEKPDKPPKHLVAYFVVVDIVRQSILLVDHIKAEKWLPPGGHVEPNEDPKITVEREALEELGITANFIKNKPFFITQAVTVGKTAGHTDVSLWYLIKGNIDQPIQYDPQEFNGYRWFAFDEVLAMDISALDPHMHRCIRKFERSQASDLK